MMVVCNKHTLQFGGKKSYSILKFMTIKRIQIGKERVHNTLHPRSQSTILDCTTDGHLQRTALSALHLDLGAIEENRHILIKNNPEHE